MRQWSENFTPRVSLAPLCTRCNDTGLTSLLVRKVVDESSKSWYRPMHFRCKCDKAVNADKFKNDSRSKDYMVAGIEYRMSKDYEVYEYKGVPIGMNKDTAFYVELSLNKCYVRDPDYQRRGRIPAIQRAIDYLDPEWVDYAEWRLERKPGSHQPQVLDDNVPF